MVDATWEQEGIFKNRPHTTLTFERQVDHVFHCLGEWDHEKVVLHSAPFTITNLGFCYPFYDIH